MTIKTNKGFTLLELLVVISIIGILVGVGAISYTNMQQKGRDTRRMEDMKAFQNAQEQYYSQNDNVYDDTGCTDGVCVVTGVLSAGIKDPKNADVYIYECDFNTTTGYCCTALLDQPGTGNCGESACDCDTPASGCTFTVNNTDGDYYCTANLQ